jgi:hypothetical protein
MGFLLEIAAGIFSRTAPFLLSDRWRLAAAIAIIFPFHTWALADAVNAVPGDHRTDAVPFHRDVLLYTFGNWEIRKGLLNNTYLLIGESVGDGEGHFWLHCNQKNMITVAVPLAERTGQERLRSQAVTIRSDTGISRAMNLLVFESFVAVAIDYDGGRKVADFVDVLRAAKETVTISYAHKSYEYNVTYLPAARARFAQLCNQMAVH